VNANPRLSRIVQFNAFPAGAIGPAVGLLGNLDHE
jgi:hypothetical protein